MFLLSVFFAYWFLLTDAVFYRSKSVPYTSLSKQTSQHKITDDKGNPVSVSLLIDDQTNYIYWYRRLFTEVCLTGECRPIDIGIYWAGDGSYLGVEVFRENLTKTDHSDFSNFDYLKLESILRDEWSALREFEFEELVENKKDSTDATTGATKKVIAEASVKDAVYTTYTMWHLIHVGENEQLALLSYQYLDKHPEILSASLSQVDSQFYTFLLNGISSGRLHNKKYITPLILKALSQEDPSLKNLAFKTIGELPLNDPSVQDQIAQAYSNWSIPDKNRFLQSASKLTELNGKLYKELASDLTQSNHWFLSAVLPVLAKARRQPPDVISRVKELAKSSNAQVSSAASKFLNEINSQK